MRYNNDNDDSTTSILCYSLKTATYKSRCLVQDIQQHFILPFENYEYRVKYLKKEYTCALSNLLFPPRNNVEVNQYFPEDKKQNKICIVPSFAQQWSVNMAVQSTQWAYALLMHKRGPLCTCFYSIFSISFERCRFTPMPTLFYDGNSKWRLLCRLR